MCPLYLCNPQSQVPYESQDDVEPSYFTSSEKVGIETDFVKDWNEVWLWK